MAYSRGGYQPNYQPYQPPHVNSSPWASGAPPGPQMYGSPHQPPHHPQPGPVAPGTYRAGNLRELTDYSTGYSPAGFGGSAPWGGRPPMGPSGGWGGGSPAGPMPTNQRIGMRGPMGGPTGKRIGGNWEGPPQKRMNKGPNRGGGNWSGQRKDGGGRKFENRNTYIKDNRRQNRNPEANKGKQNDNQNERRQQHDQAQKAAESLEKKEYPVANSNLLETDGVKDDDKTKKDEIDTLQSRYVLAVFGYCCRLCNVFLKDKSSRQEHCQTEDHTNKFNEAEVERIAKEEEEKKKKVEVEKVPEEASKKVETENGEDKEPEVKAPEQVNGKAEIENTEAEKEEPILTTDQEKTETTEQSVNVTESESDKAPEIVSENKDDDGGATTESVQQSNDVTEALKDDVKATSEGTEASKPTTPAHTPNLPQPHYFRGGGRGGPRGRGNPRGGGPRGGRGRGPRGRGRR